MKYTQILTPTERLNMIKSGMIAQLAASDCLEKDAQWLDRVVNPIKGTVLMAALTGVPVGVVWHYLDKKTGERRRAERELQEKLKFYRNVSSNIETNLANQTDPERVI